MRGTPRAVGWQLAAYAALSLLLTLGWWRGANPFVMLSGDGGTIASFAAAWAHPEDFVNDPVLNDSDRFRFYATVSIPWLIVLEPVLGSIGNAFIALLPLSLLVQAEGFRRLGVVLFGRGGPAAFLLGVVSLGTVSLSIDYYGPYPDALPRSLYQSAFPFLLAGVLRRLDQPAGWPALFGGIGLTTYLHPVSSPSVALASWLTLALGGKGEARLGRLLLAGLAFLAVSAPFAVNYLIGHDHGRVADPEAALEMHSLVYGALFTDGLVYAREMLQQWPARWFVPAWGLAGAAVVWWLAPSRRRVLATLAVWSLAAVAASLGVTLLEQWVSRQYRVVPVEIDTIRNLRYLVPVLMATGLWGAAELAARLRPAAGLALLAGAAALWLGVNRPAVLPLRETLDCLASGRLLCVPREWQARSDVLEYLRTQVPRGSLVFAAVDRYTRTEISQAVRYHSRLPLAFCYKDSAVLGFVDLDGLKGWRELERRVQVNHILGKWPVLLALAKELRAEVVLTDLAAARDDHPGWRLAHTVGDFAILERDPKLERHKGDAKADR